MLLGTTALNLREAMRVLHLLEAGFRPAVVLLGSIQADFFLPRIALDFVYVSHALNDGFPNPFVHLVFILIEPVTAKDVVTSKCWWCDCTEICLCVCIM